MLSAYGETYTHYTTPSGNTQIYIVRKRQTKSFFIRFLKERRYAVARQKLLGIMLVFIGIIGTVFFPEDATAPCVLTFLGMLRVVCR